MRRRRSGNAVDDEVLLFEHESFHARINMSSPPSRISTPPTTIPSTMRSHRCRTAREWSFFSDSDFFLAYPPSLGPGVYPSVVAHGIVNDDMFVAVARRSHHRCSREHHPLQGRELPRAAQTRVQTTKQISTPMTTTVLNDNVSSLAILSGNWKFFKDEGFITPYPVVLGPGLYSFVGRFKMNNDDMTSLMTVTDQPTLTGDPLGAHAILFEHGHFHGDHRHIFTKSPTSPTTTSMTSPPRSSSSRATGRSSETPVSTRITDCTRSGIYPSLNDTASSTTTFVSAATYAAATISNSVDDEVLLFSTRSFMADTSTSSHRKQISRHLTTSSSTMLSRRWSCCG